MIFMSKAKKLRVILKPAFQILDANGQRVQIPGKTIPFSNGKFSTEDSETIAQMLQHPYFNIKFVAVEDEKEWKAKHPEYFAQPAQMITGAVATVNSSPLVNAAREQFKEAAELRDLTKVATPAKEPIDLDTILEEKLNAKLTPVIDKMLQLLEEKAEKPKAKRTFTCPVPGCGFVGRSGIEIGEHKREVHTMSKE